MSKEMILIDVNEFIENMRELYEKAGWAPDEVHFSLNDLVMNLDCIEAFNLDEAIKDVIVSFANRMIDIASREENWVKDE